MNSIDLKSFFFGGGGGLVHFNPQLIHELYIFSSTLIGLNEKRTAYLSNQNSNGQ